MELTFNEREKEILIDVLEAHLETLNDLLADGHTDLEEERDSAQALLNKVQEA
jgi:hypothetical protein